jgi:hypothetical protein
VSGRRFRALLAAIGLALAAPVGFQPQSRRYGLQDARRRAGDPHAILYRWVCTGL